MSTASHQPLSVPMEIHFTVRPAMALNGNKCCTLQSWKTTHVSDKVQWQSGDGLQTLDEHSLGKSRNEDKEHDLLLKWCNSEFPLVQTDRTRFSERSELQQVIEDPGSTKGLEAFADFLRDFKILEFEGDDLAPSMQYSYPNPSTS
jgi:hypothetical protein